MSGITHINPVDIYRAAALQAFLTRGFAMDDAVSLAYEAAEKMESEVDKNSIYEDI